LSDVWSDGERKNVPSFVVYEHEQVVISEIEDLVDHIDEILGEIEEELLKRDQLIQHLNQFVQKSDPAQNQEPDLNNLKPDPIRQDRAKRIKRAGPNQFEPDPNRFEPDFPEEGFSYEGSPASDLFKLVTSDLAQIKSASERARECLFAQMSERTELSSMVTLKEQHIQDLEREKGELLRKLMPGAGSQLRFNVAETSGSGPNDPNQAAHESKPIPGSDDSQLIIFQLTEKVMRLERRLQCFQTSHRDSDHVRQLEWRLAELNRHKMEALKMASDAKLDSLSSQLRERDFRVFCLEQHRHEQLPNWEKETREELEKLKSEKEMILKEIRNETKALQHLMEGQSSQAPILLSNMSSGQLIQCQLNQIEDSRSRYQSTSSQFSFSPDDDGIIFGCSEINEEEEEDIFEP